jgi:hypothetical protein
VLGRGPTRPRTGPHPTPSEMSLYGLRSPTLHDRVGLPAEPSRVTPPDVHKQRAAPAVSALGGCSFHSRSSERPRVSAIWASFAPASVNSRIIPFSACVNRFRAEASPVHGRRRTAPHRPPSPRRRGRTPRSRPASRVESAAGFRDPNCCTTPALPRWHVPARAVILSASDPGVAGRPPIWKSSVPGP